MDSPRAQSRAPARQGGLTRLGGKLRDRLCDGGPDGDRLVHPHHREDADDLGAARGDHKPALAVGVRTLGRAAEEQRPDPARIDELALGEVDNDPAAVLGDAAIELRAQLLLVGDVQLALYVDDEDAVGVALRGDLKERSVGRTFCYSARTSMLTHRCSTRSSLSPCRLSEDGAHLISRMPQLRLRPFFHFFFFTTTRSLI